MARAARHQHLARAPVGADLHAQHHAACFALPPRSGGYTGVGGVEVAHGGGRDGLGLGRRRRWRGRRRGGAGAGSGTAITGCGSGAGGATNAGGSGLGVGAAAMIGGGSRFEQRLAAAVVAAAGSGRCRRRHQVDEQRRGFAAPPARTASTCISAQPASTCAPSTPTTSVWRARRQLIAALVTNRSEAARPLSFGSPARFALRNSRFGAAVRAHGRVTTSSGSACPAT